MKFLTIKCYAKINLTLNVVGKLSSGLHKIESLVSFLKLHDLIYLKNINSDKHKIYFRGKFSKGINKKNTVFNLLKILDNKKLLNNQKFEIKIIKNIPQKSGMGGGSMNAGFLLNYFLKKKILKISKKKIFKIADQIGSDVILGIDYKNTVLSSNKKLTKFKNKLNYHVLIAKPSFGCSTKIIYSKIKNFSKSKYNFPREILFRKDNVMKSQNALEKIAFKKHPKLKNIKLYLYKLPNIIFARMSGSGSSILAYFHSKKAAEIGIKQFKKKFNNYWCITSKTI